MEVILGPDVYVNASVALGSPPERVVQKVLGEGKAKAKSSPWILARVEAMLHAHPHFVKEAIAAQIDAIRAHVTVIEDTGTYGPDAWEQAMVAAAKKSGVTVVVTDHPDLLHKEQSSGIRFVSTDVWLLEQVMPPPPPPHASMRPPASNGNKTLN